MDLSSAPAPSETRLLIGRLKPEGKLDKDLRETLASPPAPTILPVRSFLRLFLTDYEE